MLSQREIRKKINIRDMGQADISSVYALDRISFGKAWTAEQMRHEMDLFGVSARLLEWNNMVLAYYFSSLVAGEASLNRIAVDPRFRGIGLGKIIMDDFLDRAGRAGAEEAFLEVKMKNDRAIKLYMEKGFEKVGRRSAYYEDGSDALIMKLDFTNYMGDVNGREEEGYVYSGH